MNEFWEFTGLLTYDTKLGSQKFFKLIPVEHGSVTPQFTLRFVQNGIFVSTSHCYLVYITFLFVENTMFNFTVIVTN